MNWAALHGNNHDTYDEAHFSTMASSSTNNNLAPAHTLIARHPRTSMTHASLSHPAETHAAAAGIFPRPQQAGPSSPNTWAADDITVIGGGHHRNLSNSLSLSDLEEAMEFAPMSGDGDSDDNSREPIEIDPTFSKDAQWPGTVKITVEATTFWAHKEVLVFASPFFEAVLKGCWAETGRPASMSSVITISQTPIVPIPTSPSSQPLGPNAIIQEEIRPSSSGDSGSEAQGPPPIGEASAMADTDTLLDTDDGELLSSEILEETTDDESAATRAEATRADKGKNREQSTDDASSDVATEAAHRAKEIQGSLSKLLGTSDSSRGLGSSMTSSSIGTPGRNWGRRRTKYPTATIHLKEEKAPIFYDFLKFVYPHLECTITWYNVEGLMNLSHKLVVPALQAKCLSFLLTHAAGRPIKAMRIAELFEEQELYREASRFVLDNPGGWPDWELHTLSHSTLWKLERRRTWFLERVLKLGLVNIAKEYACCATCPDPPGCAKLLEEKWRQNYHSLFRFGPVQPSMCYRYLRSLEGVSPPLHLTQLSCQMFAKNWIASLFDRMFQLGVHLTPLSGRGVVASPGGNAPRRHFLYCQLNDDQEKKKQKANQTGGNAGAQRSNLTATRGNT